MDFIQLRDMQDCGRLLDISAQPRAPESGHHRKGGWELACQDNQGQWLPLTDKHNQNCQFHDLDGARDMARDLGFDHLHIHG